MGTASGRRAPGPEHRVKPPLTFWERLWVLGAIFAVLFLIGALIATYGGDDGDAPVVTVERTG